MKANDNNKKTGKTLKQVKDFVTLTFFRIGTKWYADVAGKSLGQNMMVMGADTFLEGISRIHGGGAVIKTTLRTKYPHHSKFRFTRTDHDATGATYAVTAFDRKDHPTDCGNAWLCNVTHTVLGEHPERIWVKAFSVEEMDKDFTRHITKRYLANSSSYLKKLP